MLFRSVNTIEGDDYTYIDVRGDDNGDTVFKFLADNTGVEYTQLRLLSGVYNKK